MNKKEYKSISFKSGNERAEFYDDRLNFHVYVMTIWLSKQIKEKYNKDIWIIVTEVFRTREEQRRIYGENTEDVSPHEWWNAVDISVRNLIHVGIDPDELVELVNKHWIYGHGKYKCAIRHDVGKGDHIHLQAFPGTTKFVGKKLHRRKKEESI